MKRGTRWAIGLLAAGTLLVGGLSFGEDSQRGPGWRRGPGMMWGADGYGYGPGMMNGRGGYGPGMMGGGMMGLGWGGAFSQLPAEKREQLRKLQVSTSQAMVALMVDMHVQQGALGEAMSKYPVDTAGAKKAQEALNKLRDQMFTARQSAVVQAQQIVGKEAWENAQSGSWGPGMMGFGGPCSD